MNGDGTHNKKQIHELLIYNKGATPIEKNVIVVDEKGNEYERTYPKRAKGLVKNGRARFIDENTICLACPPQYETEDIKMSENKEVKKVINPETVAEPKTEVKTNIESVVDKMSLLYCIEQIEKINLNTEYIFETVQALGGVASGVGPGDVAGQEKAKALGDIVRCRETTNQRLIAFYEKMYDDLKPKETPLKIAALSTLSDLFGTTDPDQETLEKLSDIFDTIRHLG